MRLSRVALRKSSSENKQKIYKGTPKPNCDFNRMTKKLYFVMGVLLQICCMFSQHLFTRTPKEGCL